MHGNVLVIVPVMIVVMVVMVIMTVSRVVSVGFLAAEKGGDLHGGKGVRDAVTSSAGPPP